MQTTISFLNDVSRLAVVLTIWTNPPTPICSDVSNYIASPQLSRQYFITVLSEGATCNEVLIFAGCPNLVNAKALEPMLRENKLHHHPQVGLVYKEQMVEIISRMPGNEIVKTSVGNYQARRFGWITECYFVPAFFQFAGDGQRTCQQTEIV